MMVPVESTEQTLLTGRIVTPDAVVEDGVVLLVADRIAFVGPSSQLPREHAGARTPEGWVSGRTLLPGLVDAHCHGGAGGEFGPDLDSSRLAARHHHLHGTTTLLGSLVSNGATELLHGVRSCSSLVAAGELAGIHLEGPFLSMDRRGAQNPAVLTDVDPALVESLVLATAEAGAPGAIAQMTYAPERPGGDVLPRLLAGHGIIPALGHTDADADTAWASLRAGRELGVRGGRPLVTHVFNGMPPLHHRAPGPVAACLAQAAAGDAVLEVIGDGVHLSAGTVRMLFELVGPDAICLITDAMAASGMPDGTYLLGGQEVTVAERTARLTEGGSIAGGVATLLDVVRWCVFQAGIGLLDAVTAASRTPARTLDLPGVGTLEAGHRADLLVVDDGLALHAVLRHGRWLERPVARR